MIHTTIMNIIQQARKGAVLSWASSGTRPGVIRGLQAEEVLDLVGRAGGVFDEERSLKLREASGRSDLFVFKGISGLRRGFI